MVIYIWLLACDLTTVQWSFGTVLYLIEVVLDNLLFCARSTVDLAV